MFDHNDTFSTNRFVTVMEFLAKDDVIMMMTFIYGVLFIDLTFISFMTCWKSPPRAEHSLSKLSMASMMILWDVFSKFAAVETSQASAEHFALAQLVQESPDRYSLNLRSVLKKQTQRKAKLFLHSLASGSACWSVKTPSSHLCTQIYGSYVFVKTGQ